MNFPNAVKSGFRNYANFSGRASRSEYWWWQLFALILSLGVSRSENLSAIAFFGLILPSFAVAWRRAHDSGRGGFWNLIPLVGFIVALQATSPELNKYGPPPAPSTI